MFKTLQSKKLDFIFASRYQANSGSEDDTIVTYLGNQFFSKLGNCFSEHTGVNAPGKENNIIFFPLKISSVLMSTHLPIFLVFKVTLEHLFPSIILSLLFFKCLFNCITLINFFSAHNDLGRVKYLRKKDYEHDH